MIRVIFTLYDYINTMMWILFSFQTNEIKVSSTGFAVGSLDLALKFLT